MRIWDVGVRIFPGGRPSWKWGGILAGRYSGDYFLMVGKEFLRAMVSTRVGGKRGEKITLDSFFGGDVGEGKCCRRPEAELILHGWMPEYT